MRWSQLKNLLESIFHPKLKLSVFCTAQRGEHGSIGRYWFVLDKDTIWDFPKRVSIQVRAGLENTDASVMTNIMRAYLDTPKEELLNLKIEGDNWGLVELLRAADRRIGKKRLVEMDKLLEHGAAKKVIAARLNNSE